MTSTSIPAATMIGTGESRKTKEEEEEEEEGDYMSDAILEECTASQVRPGLKMTYARRREHEMLKKKAELDEADRDRKRSKKTREVMEEEKRREGLDTRLDSSNRGFAMLQKMGYKPGDGLGKKDVTGRVDPIPIEVKKGRGGLGREAVLREVTQRKAEFLRRRMEKQKEQGLQVSAQEFRAHHSRQRRVGLFQADLYKSQKSCQQLDQGKDIKEPAEKWFWPPLPPLPPDDGEQEVIVEEIEEDQLEVDEQLAILTGYLRGEYMYCLWCGCHYADLEEMAEHCPGDDRDAHDV